LHIASIKVDGNKLFKGLGRARVRFKLERRNNQHRKANEVTGHEDVGRCMQRGAIATKRKKGLIKDRENSAGTADQSRDYIIFYLHSDPIYSRMLCLPPVHSRFRTGACQSEPQ
jgi:hypothetical protein